MKLRHLLTIITTLGLNAVFSPLSHASDFPNGSPAFVSSYETAVKTAKDSGKPLVLVFSASWCPPCQANKKEVYPSASVKPFHDKFVWAYLDADEDSNAPAMQKYGVSGIPHIQFLKADGAVIGSMVGGTSPDRFSAVLADVLKKSR